MKQTTIRSALAAGALWCSSPFSLAQEPKEAQGDKSAKTAEAAVQVDPGIPEYAPVSGVSGNIKSVGSDTMNKLMGYWGEGFRKLYPNVQIEIEGKGSSSAPPALIEGSAQFGPMSRPMKKTEIDEFEKKFGYPPTGIATSIDMLAVFVHKDCPLQSLTLQQADAIFGKNRKAGFAKDVKTWGDLGLTGEWADKPISLYGRNSASGTYGFFKEHVLKNSDFKDTVKEQAGSSSVVQGVASDKFAMGYSGIGYKTADVRAVPLAADAKGKAIEANVENAYSGEYPLSRFLLVYVNKAPNESLDPLRREFLRYALTKQGQMDVVKDGYFPLTAKVAKAQRAKLGISE